MYYGRFIVLTLLVVGTFTTNSNEQRKAGHFASLAQTNFRRVALLTSWWVSITQWFFGPPIAYRISEKTGRCLHSYTITTIDECGSTWKGHCPSVNTFFFALVSMVLLEEVVRDELSIFCLGLIRHSWDLCILLFMISTVYIKSPVLEPETMATSRVGGDGNRGCDRDRWGTGTRTGRVVSSPVNPGDRSLPQEITERTSFGGTWKVISVVFLFLYHIRIEPTNMQTFANSIPPGAPWPSDVSGGSLRSR